MTAVDLDDFNQEKECTYDGEQYSARDNGAVLRQPRPGKRQRSLDAQWTFGKANDKNGYMEIASVRVHRIIATAFHGHPPTPEHVVDHIDTNRRNNRPDNLRWLTRLENVLKNPITMKRIEFACGSIEAFLADPSKLHGNIDPNFQWMRTVSREEAKACMERMHLWLKNDTPSTSGALGDWVFQPISDQKPFVAPRASEVPTVARKEPLPAEQRKWNRPPEFLSSYSPPKTFEAPSDLVMARTPGAAQRKWRVPAEFPCCPQEHGHEPIATYAARLATGATFAQNDFSQSIVLAVAMANDRQSLWVMCEQVKNAVKPWSLAQITFENGLYVHTSLGTFFDRLGAEKYFCLAQGLEWTGEDSIDDYC